MSFCPQCGSVVDGKFCASCGHALTPEPAETTTTPTAPVVESPRPKPTLQPVVEPQSEPAIAPRAAAETESDHQSQPEQALTDRHAGGEEPDVVAQAAKPRGSNRKLFAVIGVLTVALIIAVGVLIGMSGNDTSGLDSEDVAAAVIASDVASEMDDEKAKAEETTTTTTTTSTTTTTTEPPSLVLNEPAGLFCRDLNALGYNYSEAVEYWEHHGRTEQMDASGTGIPCQTVYPRSDVEAEWGAERLWPPCPSITELEQAAFRLASEYEPGISPFPLTNARCVGTWAVAETPVYYFPEVHPHYFKLDADGTPTAVTYGTGVYCGDLDMIPQDPAYGIICGY